MQGILQLNAAEQSRIQRLVSTLPLGKQDYTQEPIVLVSGLLNKIAFVLGQSAGDSPIKFWLATCLESFIRGCGPEIQIFVALSNNGCFLNKIVQEICDGAGAGSGGLQTNFDLLGELIKLNPIVLRLLDSTLGFRDNNKRFDAFMQIVSLHLVDSNVLLRSMLLTIEHEAIVMSHNRRSEGSSGGGGAVYTRTRFHTYLDPAKQPVLLGDMSTTVSPDNVTQENLCALNTSLIIFIFAHRKNKLVEYIQALKTIEIERGGGAGIICVPFRQLLWFWKEYYYNRASDRRSLENSSRLEFGEFSEVVQVLTQDDCVARGSLLNAGSEECQVVETWKRKTKRMIQIAVDRQRH